MLTLILILAQLQLSHFERLHMPAGREWVNQHKQPLKCVGEFIMPSSGYTLHYKDLGTIKLGSGTVSSCDGGAQPPQDYGKKDIPVAPQFCDHESCAGGNQEPIYDVDESYDHITVKAKPGTHWWYTVTIAVPKER